MNLMSDLTNGLHIWNARCQSWNLMSGLPTDLHIRNATMSSLESDVRFTYRPPYMECQVSILESHVRLTKLASIYGMPGIKLGI